MLINYRHYTTMEMINILANEHIYFSRHQLGIRGRPKNPDVITLTVQTDQGFFPTGIIDIRCEIYNKCAGIRDIMRVNNFSRDKDAVKYEKLWTIPFKSTLDATKLLDNVLAGLDEAFNSAPLHMYASTARKALADYRNFMKSSIPKVSYRDIVQCLGSEPYIGEKMGDSPEAAAEFIAAPYSKDRWVAWASGDLVVPLFTSEWKAVKFLKTRAKLFDPLEPAAITTIPSGRKNNTHKAYTLTDQTKDVKERVDWIRAEIARLSEQERQYVSEMKREGVYRAMK